MKEKSLRSRAQKSSAFLKKAQRIIPLGSQMFSRSYMQWIKGVAPLYVKNAKGAHLWDIDGNEYIDYINSLLAVILGYQYPAVDKAISAQMKKGISFSLSSTLEYDLSQLLIKHIPSAEMVRFAKNGSDAPSGAIRLARAVTGRDHVAACGYHGWHDWYIGATTRNLGVPGTVCKMTHLFKYNDLDSLEKILKRYKCAAVIMEPMNYIEPETGFLEGAKRLAHKYGALFIFDEIITGFRFHIGGAQKLFGVTPDLSTFGKSMSNGMPISALVGKREYMEKVKDIFYSFTFSSETLSIAAAIATIKEMETKPVTKTIWTNGARLQGTVNALIEKENMEETLSVVGKPCWQVFSIKGTKKYSPLHIKTYIQQELLRRNILWYGQHNMSYSHTKKDLDKTIVAYKEIIPLLGEVIRRNRLEQKLEGGLISDIFKVR